MKEKKVCPKISSALLSREGFFLWIYSALLIVYLGELRLPLSFDEAYYWDWARVIDFGYYSKPPMVAWLIGLTTSLLGDTEFGVRAPAVLLRILGLTLSFLLFFRYFDRLRARLILFTLAFSPIFVLYSFIMTIDPPLFFFWITSILSSILFLEKKNSLTAFLFGLSLGLGLLSKQTMLAYALLFLLYLFLFERALLKSRLTILWILVAGVIVSPNLLWNLKNGLVMLKHTGGHFSRFLPGPKGILEYLGGLLLHGPLLIPLFFYFSYKYLKVLSTYFRTKVPPVPEEAIWQFKLLNLFFVLSFPPLAILLPLGLMVKMNINWLSPFFISLYFFTLALAVNRTSYLRLSLLNILLSFLLSLAFLALPKKPDLFGLKVAQLFFKFSIGPQLAHTVENYYQRDLPLLTTDRYSASLLAFYLKEKPKPYVLNFSNLPKNQYHLWRNAEILKGQRVILIKKGTDPPPYLQEALHLKTIEIEHYGKKVVYSLWKGLYLGVQR